LTSATGTAAESLSTASAAILLLPSVFSMPGWSRRLASSAKNKLGPSSSGDEEESILLPEGPHAPKKKINIKKKKNGGGSNVKIVHSNSVTLWRLSAEYQIYFLSLRMIKVMIRAVTAMVMRMTAHSAYTTSW
jgi:hypothetical protein